GCVGGVWAAGGDHAGRAEHFAADVVTVQGVEVCFRYSDGAVAVGDGDNRGVQEATGLGLGSNQSIRDCMDLHGDCARIQPVQGVEIVDGGFQEDGAGGALSRVLARG